MLKEFKEFAIKGNMLALALAVVIGGAFSKIVTSLVNDIITPLLGLLLGKVNFEDLHYDIPSAIAGGKAVSINFGLFIQAVIDFLIIAFSLFMFVKAITSMKKKEVQNIQVASPVPSKEEELLTEIRDLLRERT